jgi:SOS-response transcriptional repressor LexA
VADSGEDVVAQINDKLTLKTFHVGKGDRKGFWLLPHNDDRDPIKVTAADDPRIIGVLYEVRRRVRTGRRKNGKK